MKNGERIEKKVKYNNDFLLKYRIYPNGHYKEEEGNTLVFLRLSRINKHKIESLEFNYEIKCNHLNIRYIGRGFTAPGNANFFGWQDGFMRLLDYKNDNTLKHLIFTIFIHITYIKYKNNTIWIKPFKLNKKTTLNCKLNKQLKTSMNNWPIGKSIICDVSNDGCWVMNFAPKGFTEINSGQPCVKYTFLKWCHKIKKIDILKPIFTDKQINIIDDEPSIFDDHFFIDHRLNSMILTLQNNPLDTDTDIEFDTEITISRIWDCNDHQHEQFVFEN